MVGVLIITRFQKAQKITARRNPNGIKNFGALLTYWQPYVAMPTARGRGQAPGGKGARPMSVSETIALLTLVLVAIKLGFDLKK